MSIRVAVIGAGVMGAVLQVGCDASEARIREVADATGTADIAEKPVFQAAPPA